MPPWFNLQEARSLLGKLEYQRGNVEGALRVFEGIDLQAAIQRLQPSLAEKPSSRRGRFRTESLHAVSQHAASLVLEAIYLKAKSLQKLGRVRGKFNFCSLFLATLNYKSTHGSGTFVVLIGGLQRLLENVKACLMLWKRYSIRAYLMFKLTINCKR